ncbi:hypothetical protein GCM10007052_35540 [Halioglobus japonicus]|nr:hypothetical protein GCM10007052_35540 [Halioglobus japonicus]
MGEQLGTFKQVPYAVDDIAFQIELLVGVEPQPGQIQRVPLSSGASRSMASGAIWAVMHQQLSAGWPAAMAHWLGSPQRGH